jgi:hypothetical protein
MGLAIPTGIVLCCLGYRFSQCRFERQITADLLRKSPEGDIEYFTTGVWWRDALMGQFNGLRNVQSVWLKGHGVSSDDLAPLRSFTYLESISLDDCPVGDAGARYIGEIGTLRYLFLFGCGLTDGVWTHVEQLKRLESLCLSWDDAVTGRGVSAIAKLPPRLVALAIESLGVTDEAIPELRALQQLHTLDIRNTSISPKGVELLRRSLPDTIILAP